jgi:hypothetical protein
MKDFSNASFQPDIIKIMTLAMNGALSTLPHPVSSTQTQAVAETILGTAKDGERDAKEAPGHELFIPSLPPAEFQTWG